MANRQHHARASHKNSRKTDSDNLPNDLRIIGGRFRGSKLRFASFVAGGDAVTRPMKHRVREAIFDLIGTEVKGRYAIDLFAGTGALGLEGLSRGAVGATFIERHIPTARVIEENITSLGVEADCEVLATSAFLWAKRDMLNSEFGIRNSESLPSLNSAIRNPQSAIPWLVFCSPPYAFYVDRQDDMLALVSAVLKHAPPGSMVVVESDERFDFNLLPGGTVGDKRDADWQVRTYSPAVVGVWRK